MRATRTARVAHQLQQEIAMIIQRELKDPAIGFVTITRVTLSADGRYAKVFFSCLGGSADRERSQDVLDRSAGFVYSLVKKRFRLKVIPILSFHYDASIEGTIEMERTFERLKPPSETE